MIYVYYLHRLPTVGMNLPVNSALVELSGSGRTLPTTLAEQANLIVHPANRFDALQRGIDAGRIDHVYLLGPGSVHGWRVHTTRTVRFVEPPVGNNEDEKVCIAQARVRIIGRHPESYWQIGCNHARLGWKPVFPNKPGYMQGWNFGRTNETEEQ